MGQTNLDVIDTPILRQTGFGPDMKRWQPNSVDSLNTNFSILSQWLNNIIVLSSANIGGSGAGPINVTVVGLTSSGYVNANLISTSNPGVSIASVVPGANSFAITFSSDPGASAIITYQAFTAQPQ